MKTSLPCIFVAVLFLAFVSACSNVGSISRSNTQSGPPPPSGPPAPPPPPVQSVITECGTSISSPGTYTLNSSLDTQGGDEPCITIANAKDITLNCNGNSITGVGEFGVSVSNVSSFVLENCTVNTGKGDGLSALLALNNVSGGTITGSTFGSGQSDLGGVLIIGCTNVTLGSQLPSAPTNPSITAATNPSISDQISNAPEPSNLIYGYIDAANNVNLVIEGNALTSGTSTALNSFMIGIFGGENTRVVNNSVNGLGNPIPVTENGIDSYDSVGTDDDILIEDETGPGSLVSGNLLVNTWDCGIETVGFMKNMTLSNNRIDMVGTSIGGWYYVSVTGVQYTQNVSTNIEYAGVFYARHGGLRAAGKQLPFFAYRIPADMPAETTVNFTQNQFTGNTFSQPITVTQNEVGALIAEVYSRMLYTAESSLLPGTEPTPQQFLTVNNTFTNNSFTGAFDQIGFGGSPPWTYTSDDVIDGGGNICSGSLSYVPSVSPTFGDTTVAIIPIHSINCGNGN